MSFVLDSSVALAWCFEDERTDATDALLRQVALSGAVASALWPLEVLNALLVGERRGRLDADKRQTLAGFLRDLPIRLDDKTAEAVWRETSALAARFQLTVYDASYLELAQRLERPLATRDRALRVAANRLGVPLLGEESDLRQQ